MDYSIFLLFFFKSKTQKKGRQKYQTGEKNVFPQKKKKKMKEMSLLELSMETENQHDLRSTVSPEEQQR